MDGWTMGPDGWLLMGTWMLALLFIVWLLVHEPGDTSRDTPLEILRARFARGEISRDEFDQARRLLGL